MQFCYNWGEPENPQRIVTSIDECSYTDFRCLNDSNHEEGGFHLEMVQFDNYCGLVTVKTEIMIMKTGGLRF